MNQNDEKVLEQLGLKDIPTKDKQVVLEMIDERLMRRFLANVLVSIPEDKRSTLDAKIDEIDKPNASDIFRIAIDLHPDAPKILAQSSQEVIDELKQDTTAIKAAQLGNDRTNPPTAAGPEDLPPVDNSPAPIAASSAPEPPLEPPPIQDDQSTELPPAPNNQSATTTDATYY